MVIFNETHWLPKMYETIGDQRVHWRRLLDIAKNTSWVSGECLLDVNSKWAGHDSYTDIEVALEHELALFGEVNIQIFSEVLVSVLFGDHEYWGDKTPDYGYHMDAIQHIWPHCKFLHIFRNPVDVAVSMAQHPGFQLMAPSLHESWSAISFDHLFDRVDRKPYSKDIFLNYCCRRVARIRDYARSLSSRNYLEINYEDIVERPLSAFERISEFIGVEAEQEWIESVAKDVRAPNPKSARSLEELYCLDPRFLSCLRSDFPDAFNWLNIEPEADVRMRRINAFKGSNSHKQLADYGLSAIAAPSAATSLKEKRAMANAVSGALDSIGQSEASSLWGDWASTMAFPGPPNPNARDSGQHADDEVSELRVISKAENSRLIGGVAVFSCIRNERERLPYFLEYYRNSGVDSFFFVDNASDDGSTQYLSKQSDCTVYWAAGSYAGSNCGVDWINEVLRHHSDGQWAIVVDADELLVYPDVETLDVREFTAKLDQENSNALYTVMMDMYSDKPIGEVSYQRGECFLDYCSYFDRDGFKPGYRGLPAFGGVRSRIFWEGRGYEKKPPYLPKIPLIKWHSGLAYKSSTHSIDGVRLAVATGVLLHFKLFDDFIERAFIETNREEHWLNAAEYKIYVNGLASIKDSSLLYSGSVLYQDSSQLIDLGIMTGNAA